MANRAVQLYKYIKLPDLGWRYCKAVFYPNSRIKAHAFMTPTGEQTIKDGCYCLYYNRKWEPVGNEPIEAQRLLLRKRGELQTIVNGGTVLHPCVIRLGRLRAWIHSRTSRRAILR
jgi:hypothetical protein